MKIITWNCQMAFRNKAEYLLDQRPDIVIVPECEHPDKLKFKKGVLTPNDLLWFGSNQHKGLGVISYSGFKFRLLDIHNPQFKNILPLSVTDGSFSFTLFAIWANNPQDKDGAYVTQIWKAIHFYEHLLHDTRTMLAGDFNSNTIWDKPLRIGNHSALVEKLGKKGIFSTYHHFHNQEHGKEQHSTLFMYRHEVKPYHIDYCFASLDFIQKLENVEVGNFENWKHLSDHTPVSVTFRS